jgi:hypothetical protein
LCKLSPQGVTPVRTTGRTPVWNYMKD